MLKTKNIGKKLSAAWVDSAIEHTVNAPNIAAYDVSNRMKKKYPNLSELSVLKPDNG